MTMCCCQKMTQRVVRYVITASSYGLALAHRLEKAEGDRSKSSEHQSSTCRVMRMFFFVFEAATWQASALIGL